MEDHSDIGSETGNVSGDSSEPRLVDTGTPRVTSLSEADKEAVDRLFQDGLEHAQTKDLDDRETAVLQILANLEQYPAESSTEELVDATLAGIDRYEAGREDRFSVASDQRSPGRSIRLPDFFATAAALFLAVGIGVPLFQSIQSNERITMSQHRLGTVGSAIAGFSIDRAGALPLSESDDQRETPLHRQAYSQNLSELIDGDRCGFSSLFAGSEAEATPLVGYRVFVNRKTFNYAQFSPDDVLLSDPNPVLESFRVDGRRAGPMSGAAMHDEKGLVVFRFDGSTPFIVQPIVFDADQKADSKSSPRMDMIWVSDGYRHGDQDGIGWPNADSDDVLAQ
jgi:hypothetical protein